MPKTSREEFKLLLDPEALVKFENMASARRVTTQKILRDQVMKLLDPSLQGAVTATLKPCVISVPV